MMNALPQPIEEVTTSTRPYRGGWGSLVVTPTETEVGSLTALVQKLAYEAEAQALPLGMVWDSTATETEVNDLYPPPTVPELVSKNTHSGQPSPRDRLDAELLSYEELPHGWDGYVGVAASPDAIADAIDFLNKKPDDIPLPYPQIAPDGEVGLYWRTEKVYAEIGFYGGGEFSYYARYTPAEGKDGEPDEAGDDDCRVDDVWPERLLLILGKLQG